MINKEIRFSDGLTTEIESGIVIDIVLSMAGGKLFLNLKSYKTLDAIYASSHHMLTLQSIKMN